MGTIDAMPFRFRPFTIAGVSYDTAAAVPFRLWMTVFVAMVAAKLEKRRRRPIHLSQLSADELKDIGIAQYQTNHDIRRSVRFLECNR